jgi:hypothetical protein
MDRDEAQRSSCPYRIESAARLDARRDWMRDAIAHAIGSSTCALRDWCSDRTTFSGEDF